jgi:SAM-dependent methyltransferase
MEWVEEFYSRTGAWWGGAESGVGEVDRRRAAEVVALGGSGASVLELGCGYGSTARACAAVGLRVTAIDLSDRIQFATTPALSDNPTFIRGDFYCAELGSGFDVVCYWDGFGVGEDADQRRLLRRVAQDWLAPHGGAIVEVFDPVWWAAQAGFEETKEARPDEGYPCSLGHRRTFDAKTCRALDSWWEVGSSDGLTQSLRCYSPADLVMLVQGTGLRIDETNAADESAGEEPRGPSYLALLRPA